MSQPTVCAVMLVNGRPEMVRRALNCFKAQTYPNLNLMMFDTGKSAVTIAGLSPLGEPGGFYEFANDAFGDKLVEHIYFKTIHDKPTEGMPIGYLRNVANHMTEAVQIIVHWDSDDWSHPNRIAEQVALLQASGKECVGYRDMLFWRSLKLTERDVYGPEGSDTPCDVVEDAWLYRNSDPRYCLGTSLCYWRKTWEHRPFPDLPKAKGGTGEDTEWLKEVASMGADSVVWNHPDGGPTTLPSYDDNDPPQPRMIASIHGANTQYYDPAGYVAGKMGTSWQRAAAWDDYCRKEMAL